MNYFFHFFQNQNSVKYSIRKIFYFFKLPLVFLYPFKSFHEVSFIFQFFFQAIRLPMSFLLTLALLLLFPSSVHSVTCNRFSCSNCPVELLLRFVLDTSGSVGASNFKLAKDFTSNIIQAMDNISPTNSRLAYVTFDDSNSPPLSLKAIS